MQLDKTIAKSKKRHLSIALSCEKFHKYIYGLHFVVENDHKPLISIFQRALSKSPPRIQRLLPGLQRYNFQLIYVPGNQLFVADILSRLPLPDSTSEITSDEMNYFVHSLIKSSQISEDRLQQIIPERKKTIYYNQCSVTNSKWMD